MSKNRKESKHINKDPNALTLSLRLLGSTQIVKKLPNFVHPILILHNRSHATIYSDPRIYLHIIIMQKDMNRAMNFPFS